VASDIGFRPQLRLHPLSWIFSLTRYLRQFIVPLGAFVLFGARDNGQLWGLLLIVPLVIGALWQQWIYRYGFGPRGLVIQEGLFFRNVRQIEYARIENIDVERGVLHRLLGVAQVSIATSTGGKAEASIRVLSLPAVQALRERIFSQAQSDSRAEARTADHAEEVLLHLAPGELIRYGLIDNRGLWIVAAVLGFLSQEGLWQVVGATLARWFTDSTLQQLVVLGLAVQVAVALAAILVLIAALRVFSIVGALITLFDFTLTRHEHDFRVRHGLLTRVALNLRVRRIQSVHQTQTLLHRLFDRVSLRVDLAGDSSSQERKQESSHVRTRWLAPLCSPQQAGQLIAAALPDAHLDTEPAWQPLAPHARGRLFRRTVYVWTVLGLLALLILGILPQAPVQPDWRILLFYIPVLAAVAWVRAHLYVKNTRWALTPDALLFRHGWPTRRLSVLPRNRLQSVQLSSSPFDQHYDMANVSIDTAGAGSLNDRVHIRLLAAHTAAELARTLYRSRVMAAPDAQRP
jgi:putative membrane protein